MSKLVMLNEIRNEKIKNNDNNIIKEDVNESYITFMEKFCKFENEEDIINLNKEIIDTKYEEKINRIIEKIFLLDNKIPLIDFINSIYKDDLCTNTEIKLIRNSDTVNKNYKFKILRDVSYEFKILAEDGYRKFEYEIQFQTNDSHNIAFTVVRNDLSINCNKIVNFNKKRREHQCSIENGEKKRLQDYNKPWLIMLNSDIQVPDVYKFKSDNNKDLDYEFNIFKSWKYDFKRLFQDNMYLLFPMKVFDLKKRLSNINEDTSGKDIVKDEILRFFREMNIYLGKLKESDLITEKDVNEFNLIAIDLLNDFIKEKNNIFIDIKKDIEDKLKNIVV